MSDYRFVVTTVVSIVLLLLSAATEASNDTVAVNSIQGCKPRIVRAPTRFPEKAQARGASGEVRLRVLVNERGVLESKLARSSGHRLLDRAAIESVGEDWKFDVSHCDADFLPTSIIVVVHYKPVPIFISFGVEHRSIAATALLASDERCTVTPTGRREQLVACLQ